MNGISTEWSMVWVLACIVLSIALSYILYSKGVFKSSLGIRRFLFALRFATLFILTFLLLKPYINQSINHKEQAIILFGIDNSSSLVAHADSNYYTKEFLNEIENLKQELAEDFKIETYAFGEKVERNPRFDFKDRKTNLSEYLNEISAIYSNQNVVANIIASDGIYNAGSNPLYANYLFDAPLYTITLGDTVAKKDLEISNVSYNEIAYLGNTFPVEVTVLSQFSEGQSLEVSVFEGEVLLHKKDTLIHSDNGIHTFDFRLSAQSIGIHNYRIEIKPLAGESNTANNEQNIFVDVLESKQKILLLTEVAHPDIAAISTSIQSNENYELVVQKSDEFDGDCSPYSLLVAYQTQVMDCNLPTFYFIGNRSESLTLDWFSYSPLKSSLNEVNADFKSFSLFSVSDDWPLWLKELPPLYSPLAKYSFSSEHHNLFTQNILGVDTENPILSFSQNNGLRQAVCVAEGLWKWRLYEYLKTNKHQLFDELINKSVQFLSVKEDKRPFRLKHEKLIYENESLAINAELYDANYELVNNAEVSIQITDSQGNDFNYLFNRTSKSYALELNQLAVGNYNYQAQVIFNGKELINKGKFTILPLEHEKLHSIAKPQVLYTLSQKYEGKSFSRNEFSALKQQLSTIDSKSLSYVEESQSDLINLKWIFILLFVFLSVEWFLRKRNTNI